MNQKNDYFRDENDEIKYNELCETCSNKCKQSWRTQITWCPTLKKKLNKKKGGK